MKRSHEIQLSVIGTLAMLGVQYATEERLEVKQNIYANRANCEKDWGSDTRECDYSAFRAGYTGPRYYWDREIGRPVAVYAGNETQVINNSYLNRGESSMAKSVNVSTISRGGFGSSGRGSSGG